MTTAQLRSITTKTEFPADTRVLVQGPDGGEVWITGYESATRYGKPVLILTTTPDESEAE